HSFAEAAPLLARQGCRVIVPYLRGYGETRFRALATFRNGQPAALAFDVVALMDALGIGRAVLAGFDWGARSANIVAALWPEGVGGLAVASASLTTNRDLAKRPLPPAAELKWWYQFYFSTERGRRGYTEYRREFAKLIWQIASPQWRFDDATFDRSAAAF